MLVLRLGNVKMLCKCQEMANTGQKVTHTQQFICLYHGGLWGEVLEWMVPPLASYICRVLVGGGGRLEAAVWGRGEGCFI